VTKYLRKNLRKEGFILAYGFRGFRPWSLGSVASGSTCGEVENHGGAHVGERSGSPDGGDEGQGQDIPFTYMLPVTNFFQSGSTSQ
jgi:hypothetical protein